MLSRHEQVCPDQKQDLDVGLSRNTIIDQVQELAGNLTTQLVEKEKKNPLTVTMGTMWPRMKQPYFKYSIAPCFALNALLNQTHCKRRHPRGKNLKPLINLNDHDEFS